MTAAALATFEYELEAKNDRPWWKFWVPKDVVYGTIAATSEQVAIEALATRRLAITDVRRISPASAFVRRALFYSRVPEQSVLEFFANYATMTDTGDITPAQACETLSTTISNAYFSQVVKTIGRLIAGQTKLWQACSFFPDVFSRFIIAVIRSGEDKGQEVLQRVLRDLEDELRRQKQLGDFRKRVNNGLKQVGFAVGIMLLVTFAYTVRVLAPTGTTHAGSEAAAWWAAPVVFLSNLLDSWWFDGIAIAALFAIYVAFRIYLTTPRGTHWWDTFTIRNRGLYSKYAQLEAQGNVFVAYLRLIDVNEVPFTAWTEASATAANTFYEVLFLEVRDRVERGVKLPEALRLSEYVDLRAVAVFEAAEPKGSDVLAFRMARIGSDMREEARRGFEDVAIQNDTRAQWIFAGAIVISLFVTLVMFGNALTHLG